MEKSRAAVALESPYTLHIAPPEWRWVIVVSTAFIFLVFVPFFWVALNDPQGWQFMGSLHNYLDGGSYLSKMAQGQNGEWLVRFLHTPEAHEGIFIQVLYPLLGHLARFTSLPLIVLFHVARVIAALFMYLAIYHLAASIWQRVRARRIFFAIAAVGAGFGWLLGPALQSLGLADATGWPDLTVPEMYPLFSTLINVHFPLTIACLALLASLLVAAFRPGGPRASEAPINLPAAAVLSLILALIYPQSLVPIIAAVAVYAGLLWRAGARESVRQATRWLLALILPAVPFAAYNLMAITNMPVFAEWNRQNVTLSPSPILLILGLGLPLLVAIPGLYRALRRFQQTDDRLMLLWLAAMLVLMYLPTNFQRRFAVGMMLPVAYFATRAVEDVWFRFVSPRWRGWLFALFVPVIAISPVFSLFLPIVPVVSGNAAQASGIFLERDYAIIFGWLAPRVERDDVILASPVVSAWLPGWTYSRVVYGHPYETLNADERRAEVEAWYARETADACHELLERYNVRYILVGPQERRLGDVACESALTPVARRGNVSVYAP